MSLVELFMILRLSREFSILGYFREGLFSALNLDLG